MSQTEWSIGLPPKTSPEPVLKPSAAQIKLAKVKLAKAKLQASKVKPHWTCPDYVGLWHDLLNQRWSEQVGCRSPQ
jgi:hypothetical protein